MSWLDSLTSAQKVVLALAVVVLLLGVWVGGGRGALPATQPEPAELIAPEPAATKVMVHVVGAVQRPGVYELPAGTRVLDAVNAAGGFAPEAERNSVNLAAFCEDGQQVRVEAVPAPTEVAAAPAPPPPTTPPAPTAAPIPPTPPRTRPRQPTDAPAQTPSFLAGAQPQPPVRINHAGLDELQRLPGIGPELARRIIYYRAEHGPFRSFSELDNVEGIGPATIAELRACATLR